MKLRSTTIALVAICLVALLMPNISSAEEEGKVKVGFFYDNENFRNNDVPLSWYASYGGIVLGYEKKLDDFWWAIDGRYKYGRLSNEKADVNIGHISGQGVVGKTYDIGGFLLKPFIGLGLSWEAQDEVGYNDCYTTEYLLPIGMRIERNTSAGLVGLDLQYAYVLGRELYVTDEDPYWGRRFFDGSYNFEVGIYHEPVSLPIGFRTYFKYEKWNQTKYWSRLEREHVGLETYVKF